MYEERREVKEKNTVTHDLQRWKTRLNCLVWSQGEDVCKTKFSLQVGLVVVCLIGLEQQADITPISYKEGKRKNYLQILEWIFRSI